MCEVVSSMLKEETSMAPKVLHAYRNGNTLVTLYEDGTKTREYDGLPTPMYPESVDLKITDYCDAGCAYCHEKSTKAGQHASLNTILRLTDGLPQGVELAIGGGDPFSHPDLLELLLAFKERGLIANITVNALHVGVHAKFIKDLRDMGLMWGLGISWAPKVDVSRLVDDKTIIHLIAGVHPVSELVDIPKDWKILILGYKFYGRGIKWAEQHTVYQNLEKWRFWIGTALRERNISFDNLGLEQLGVKDWVRDDVYKAYYMGDDGRFSMYVDAVAQNYAMSSTSPRRPLRVLGIPGAFAELQGTLRVGPIMD